MDIRLIIAVVLIAAGCFFILVAALGLLRFPDVYSRLHPAGKTDSLGQALVFLGLIVYEGADLRSVKMLFIIVFLFIANPVATHALARAAHVAGIKPWEKGEERR
ncbi:MAG: monovalent cation/H(+) antiporter subunit G [Thermodesulfobacteriota bacterium]|nr:MAG: monovalent cation/H(+) antiporter subunit G [Thermodesulfobacteriota bacterium]